METIMQVFLHFDVPKELLLWYILYGTWQGQASKIWRNKTVWVFLPFVLTRFSDIPQSYAVFSETGPDLVHNNAHYINV